MTTATGSAPVLTEPALNGGCDACGARRTEKAITPGGLVLCTDAAACCKRYRRGISPEAYAEILRGEWPGVKA